MLGGDRKSTKIGLAMGVAIGGDDAKSGKNTHLLVVMHMRLLQKIGLPDLTTRTWFKTVNGYKIRTKSVRCYWGMILMLLKIMVVVITGLGGVTSDF